jgi:colanic acid/amylovoran biosynthesis glycosyltransferase
MTRIAFVVSEFPRPVDAYFLRELLALDERGVDFRIWSLRRPAHQKTPRRAAALLDRTCYAPALTAPAMRAAHASVVRAAGSRYAAAFTETVRAHARSPRLLAKALAVWPQTVYFAARVLDEGIDHLHANWATYPAASAAAIARMTGRPWSFAGHASDIYLDRTGLAGKLRTARFVVTCTEESRRYLRGIVPEAPVHTVYHGIDLAAARVEPVPPSDFHILAVGTLRDCKGFDTLISTVARLVADGVPARLTVIGDGEDRAALENLATRLGLGARVRFTGYVAHEDVVAEYARASVLVHPARSANHFGIPNVILEAQAAKLPVVCSPLPALAELIEDGVSGVYVPEDDVTRLASTLSALWTDPERRRRLGDEGHRRVIEGFDIERTVSTLVGLLGGGATARRQAVG